MAGGVIALLAADLALPDRLALLAIGWIFLFLGRYLYECFDGLLGGLVGAALLAYVAPAGSPWLSALLVAAALAFGAAATLFRFGFVYVLFGALAGMVSIQLLGTMLGVPVDMPAPLLGIFYGVVLLFVLRGFLPRFAMPLTGAYLLAQGCDAADRGWAVLAAAFVGYLVQRGIPSRAEDEAEAGERVSPPKAVPALASEITTAAALVQLAVLRALGSLAAGLDRARDGPLVRAAARRALQADAVPAEVRPELTAWDRLADRVARIVRRDGRRGEGTERLRTRKALCADVREIWRLQHRKAQHRAAVGRAALLAPGTDPGLVALAERRRLSRDAAIRRTGSAQDYARTLAAQSAAGAVGAFIIDAAFRRPRVALLAAAVPVALAALGSV